MEKRKPTEKQLMALKKAREVRAANLARTKAARAAEAAKPRKPAKRTYRKKKEDVVVEEVVKEVTKEVPKPYKRYVKKTAEELHEVRSKAGKKGAAVRWGKVKQEERKVNKEFNKMSREIVKVMPKRTIVEEIEEVKTVPEDKIEKAILFIKANNDLSRKMLECASARLTKKINKEQITDCVQAAGKSFKKLSDIFSHYNKYAEGVLQLDVPLRKDVNRSMANLARNTAQFLALIDI